MKSALGRPPIPKKERQSKIIGLRFTSEERKDLEAAAKKAGLSLSDYIRSKLNLGRKQ
jgi:predicted HicB family RNase H-like nuclease